MKCHPVNLLGSLKQSGDMVGDSLHADVVTGSSRNHSLGRNR